MCLIYVEPAAMEMKPEEQSADIAGHVAFARDSIANGTYVTCDALAPAAAARTVRVRNGRVSSVDGPFAETKEVLGGFYVLECNDIDEAAALAAKIPPAQRGCIEVRPIVEIPGWEESIGLAPASSTVAG